jgi:hypothetical protein
VGATVGHVIPVVLSRVSAFPCFQLIFLIVRWYVYGDSWTWWHYVGLLANVAAYTFSVFSIASAAADNVPARYHSRDIHVQCLCVIGSLMRSVPATA